MCIPTMLAGLGMGAGGAATVAGATAGAATIAAPAVSGLTTLGTVLSVGGSLFQGIQASQAASAQAAHIENQRRNEAVLNAIQDSRERAQFRSQIARQRAELAGRGVALDSPTAVYLGQTAAREMSFQSQATRSSGQARGQELSANARMARARGAQGLLRGGLSAAQTLLTAAPDIWPELRA